MIRTLTKKVNTKHIKTLNINSAQLWSFHVSCLGEILTQFVVDSQNMFNFCLSTNKRRKKKLNLNNCAAQSTILKYQYVITIQEVQ